MAAPTVAARTAAQATATRLKFLHESAHALALSSPTVSALLESQYDKVTREQELEVPDARRREVCGSCGSIMLPGWSSRVTQEPVRPRKNHSGKSAGQTSNPVVRAMVYHCKKCGCKTRQTRRLSYTAPKRSLKPAQATQAVHLSLRIDAGTAADTASTPATTSPAGNQVSSPSTANSSSKKRAKARKGGLQALLAKSKVEAAATAKQSYGLNLMDLMKND